MPESLTAGTGAGAGLQVPVFTGWSGVASSVVFQAGVSGIGAPSILPERRPKRKPLGPATAWPSLRFVLLGLEDRSLFFPGPHPPTCAPSAVLCSGYCGLSLEGMWGQGLSTSPNKDDQLSCSSPPHSGQAWRSGGAEPPVHLLTAFSQTAAGSPQPARAPSRAAASHVGAVTLVGTDLPQPHACWRGERAGLAPVLAVCHRRAGGAWGSRGPGRSGPQLTGWMDGTDSRVATGTLPPWAPRWGWLGSSLLSWLVASGGSLHRLALLA